VEQRVKISDLVRDAHLYGYAALIPGGREGCPEGEFNVGRTHIVPDQPEGTLYRDHQKGPLAPPLMAGDWIMHVSSGINAVVTETRGRWTFRIRALTAPATDGDQTAWLINEGKGGWICIGQAFKTWTAVLKTLGLKPPEDIAAEDYDQARKDLFRHPERLPWAQNFHVCKNWKQLAPKKRKLLKRQMRVLLKNKKFKDFQSQDMDAFLEANAIMQRCMDHGEVINWCIGEEDVDGSAESDS
jgi:hypothetical protein